MDKQPAGLFDLFLTFLTIGAISFGGGIMGYIREYTVRRRNWITEEEFLVALTLSQTVPGLFSINLSVIIGDEKRGAIGAFLAVLGMLLPGTIILLTLGSGYLYYSDNPQVKSFLMGVAAAAVAFIFKVMLEVGLTQFLRFRSLVFVLITFIAVGILHFPLIVVLLSIAPLAIWFCNQSE